MGIATLGISKAGISKRGISKPGILASNTRYAYNMDGIDDRWTLANRAINVDQDIDIEFYSPSVLSGTLQTIISQCISTTFTSIEFRVLVNASNALNFIVGGFSADILSAAEGFSAAEKYRVRLVGTTLQIWKGVLTGAPLKTTTFTRGAAREPSAQTVIGASTNEAVGTFFRYSQGIQRDIKIGGVLWPMADRNQTIQLPEPSGLGAELITPTVLENPAAKGSQWTYLGDGRWQYIGDGSFNELQLVAINNQPNAGYLEFEVESISGQMRCNGSTASIGTIQSNPVFSSVGVFRYFYTDRAALANGVRFSRNTPVPINCIIKNISFKPLGTCNPMTGVNLNPDRWVEIPL